MRATATSEGDHQDQQRTRLSGDEQGSHPDLTCSSCLMSWFILIGSGWTYSDHSNETLDPFRREDREEEEHRTGVPDRNHDWILDQHLAVGKKRGRLSMLQSRTRPPVDSDISARRS